MTINIRPLRDRLVVRPLEEETKTSGGIYLPDTAKEKPQRGEIVAVGPGKLLDNGKRAPMPVAKGDRVIYGKYSGTEVRVEGEEYKILELRDVLAKFQ